MRIGPAPLSLLPLTLVGASWHPWARDRLIQSGLPGCPWQTQAAMSGSAEPGCSLLLSGSGLNPTAKMQSWQTLCLKVSSGGGKGQHDPRAWSLACCSQAWPGWPPRTCSVLTGSQESLWAELKSGAESGWDFSSRWLVGGPDPDSLSSIRTSRMVPVDLNAFLCQAEELMGNFYSRLGG